ncbi:octanoyltransferase LipM [Listeria weihenstephanensis FSL R9-0317]|uniref:Octanoyltransferase n=1 Tax=Listeria weihenstephanensis TaxID=1006155 RepID=A0A1S7FRQ1_9LIST|nr:biotin/lipoate A/B protein ligase family protein [Listeria weihenstephanensis]AQY50121.1 octanoyltransferase [Listeria weihenstephanensis]EUJ36620.1 octanoyltransferase LipM [Listeria weihenstephanensis FSL R9-0317]
MTEKWMLLDQSKLDPAVNMAVDEKLMDWHRAGLIPPVLRFYGWTPAGLSVGYFQRTEGKIDREAVASHGFRLVRRPTGGQAVLHDDELTYSFVISEEHQGVPKTIKEAHKLISEALLLGLEKLDIDASFAMPDEKKQASGTAICFEEPSWYEITLNGRKVIGSAQARHDGILLQHGSIPLHMNAVELFDLFVFENDRVKERMLRAFGGKAAGIFDLIGREIPIEEMKEAFQRGFAEVFEVSFETLTLTDAQWDEIHTLAEQKFRRESYLFSR